MDFSSALKALKRGNKLSRELAPSFMPHSSRPWVVMMPSLDLPPHNSQSPGAKVNDRTAKHIGSDTPLKSQPYFALWVGDGSWQPGWLPSTNDLLADDWEIVG